MTINPDHLLCKHPLQKCTERLRDQRSVNLTKKAWSWSRESDQDQGSMNLNQEERSGSFGDSWTFTGLLIPTSSLSFLLEFWNWRIWKRSWGGYSCVILRPLESYLVWLYRNQRGCVMRNSSDTVNGSSVSALRKTGLLWRRKTRKTGKFWKISVVYSYSAIFNAPFHRHFFLSIKID